MSRDDDGPLVTWRWHVDRRPIVLKVKLSEGEKQLVQYRARLESVTVSEFIRRALFAEDQT